MTIRDMLIYVDHTESTRNAFDRIVRFARPRDIRLTALYVDSWTLWVSGFGAEMSPAVIDAQHDMAEKRKAEVKQRIESQAGEAGYPFHWLEDEGEVPNVVCRHAGGVDAVVLGHPWELAEFTDSALVNATAIGSGRPVLVIPKCYQREIDAGRVLVAWDGGREAARAVHDALPLLRHADEVIAVTIGTIESYTGTDLNTLVEHLRRHEVSVREKSLPDDGQSKGRVLLDTAESENTGLLVMGCYGHSRLREFVLGGCTRYVLQHSPIPVWVAH